MSENPNFQWRLTLWPPSHFLGLWRWHGRQVDGDYGPFGYRWQQRGWALTQSAARRGAVRCAEFRAKWIAKERTKEHLAKERAIVTEEWVRV